MSDLNHADLARQIGALQAQMQDTRADVTEIRDAVRRLETAANMGKGAWWMLVKVGVVLSAIVGVGAWLWQHLIGK